MLSFDRLSALELTPALWYWHLTLEEHHIFFVFLLPWIMQNI